MKTKVFFLSFCAMSFFILFPLIHYAEAECLRCQGGRELGCTGDAKFDFISKCGPPDYSEEIDQGNIAGKSVDVTTVMSYNCGEGYFVQHVTVKGGKIISITSGARGSGPVKCE